MNSAGYAAGYSFAPEVTPFVGEWVNPDKARLSWRMARRRPARCKPVLAIAFRFGSCISVLVVPNLCAILQHGCRASAKVIT